MNCSARALSRSLAVQSIPISTPCLTFLYETRTIIQPWVRRSPQRSCKHNRQFATKHIKAPEGLRLQGPQGTSYQPAKYRAKGLGQKKQKEKVTDIEAGKDARQSEDESFIKQPINAFTEILQDQRSRSKTDLQLPRGQSITMTQAEHEIFNRLQSISSKTKSVQQKVESSDLFGMLPDDKSLAAIFDGIADALDYRELEEIEKMAQVQQKYIVQSVQKKENVKATAKKILLESLQTQGSSSPEPFPSRLDTTITTTEKIDKDRTDQIQELKDLFSAVETDTDLWKLLEVHMFKDMKRLAIASRVERRQTGILKKQIEIREQAGKKFTKATEKLQEWESDQGRELLKKMTNTYGPALLYAIRLFRTGFPRSPYALLLLPTIKNLGPMSYVLAGSTSFYNELLYIQWVYYRDLNGCANLIEEMISHNILADQRTAVVYQMIDKARETETGVRKQEQSTSTDWQSEDKSVTTKSDQAGRSTKLITLDDPVNSFIAGWWQLQGIEAGWNRWSKAYERLITMTRLEMERKQYEQTLAEQGAGSLVEDSTLQGVRPDRSLEGDQDTTTEALEPEIEILPSEDLYEAEIAIAA